jgi:hypothetical protein
MFAVTFTIPKRAILTAISPLTHLSINSLTVGSAQCAALPNLCLKRHNIKFGLGRFFICDAVLPRLLLSSCIQSKRKSFADLSGGRTISFELTFFKGRIPRQGYRPLPLPLKFPKQFLGASQLLIALIFDEFRPIICLCIRPRNSFICSYFLSLFS